MEQCQQFSLWYMLAAVTAILILQSFFTPSHVQTLPYSDFKVLLKAGKLKNVTLGEGTITGTLTQQSQIYATDGASKNDRMRVRFFCSPRSCCSTRISSFSPVRSGLRATPVRLR